MLSSHKIAVLVNPYRANQDALALVPLHQNPLNDNFSFPPTFKNIVAHVRKHYRKASLKNGCTCSAVIVTHEKVLTAFVGDSPILFFEKKAGRWDCTARTTQHDKRNEKEMARVHQSGCSFDGKYMLDPRTGEGLACFRAIGDFGHQGVSAEPAIAQHFFDKDAEDFLVLIGSDGIDRAVTTGLIDKLNRCDHPAELLEHIRVTAREQREDDDISVIAIGKDALSPETPAVFAVVADGHGDGIEGLPSKAYARDIASEVVGVWAMEFLSREYAHPNALLSYQPGRYDDFSRTPVSYTFSGAINQIASAAFVWKRLLVNTDLSRKYKALQQPFSSHAASSASERTSLVRGTHPHSHRSSLYASVSHEDRSSGRDDAPSAYGSSDGCCCLL